MWERQDFCVIVPPGNELNSHACTDIYYNRVNSLVHDN